VTALGVGLLITIVVTSFASRTRLALFAATATAEIERLTRAPAWAAELEGAGRSRVTGGMVSGSLMITRYGIAFEPTGLHRYMMLTMPWSDIETATATDTFGVTDAVMLEVRCRDGSELAFVTSGRKKLRAAYDRPRA
jgi:hypothetical protein